MNFWDSTHMLLMRQRDKVQYPKIVKSYQLHKDSRASSCHFAEVSMNLLRYQTLKREGAIFQTIISCLSCRCTVNSSYPPSYEATTRMQGQPSLGGPRWRCWTVNKKNPIRIRWPCHKYNMLWGLVWATFRSRCHYLWTDSVCFW